MDKKTDSSNLSELTRKVRNRLLLVCLIGYALSNIGLVLSKVSIFGSEFALTNPSAIPVTMGFVVLYYTIIFGSYAFSDLLKLWTKRFSKGIEELKNEELTEPYILHNKIRNLERELNELDKAYSGNRESAEFLEKSRKIMHELTKLREIDYYVKEGGRFAVSSIISLLLRLVVEMLFPLILGIYICILLFFFTPIPEVTNLQPSLSNPFP